MNEAFEKWLKDNYPDYPPPLSEIWQAATQASEQRIKELEEKLKYAELSADEEAKFADKFNIQVKELTASNNQLREALVASKNVIEIAMTDRDGNKFMYLNTRSGSMLSALDTLDKCNKALSSTPAQSLAEHDKDRREIR